MRAGHSTQMISRALTFAALSAFAIHLGGCDRSSPAPEPDASQTLAPSPSPEPAVPSPQPEATAGEAAEAAPAAPDLGERRNPARVLRSYADALHSRDWPAAARFWGKGSGVTASTLKAAYNRPVAPVLEVGEGHSEGAAGSIYYEAPVVLRFGEDAPPERGTLTLRRVNDVPGATAEQLRWHIERSTIGAEQ